LKNIIKLVEEFKKQYNREEKEKVQQQKRKKIKEYIAKNC